MKKGFSLVELMVVITILGILSAVAVPKLFGLVAKAKAAEVTVVVETWIKLQETYIDQKKDVGSWRKIGFNAPGKKISNDSYQTEYFIYQENYTDNKNNITAGIFVYNTVNLNDCKANTKNAHWQFDFATKVNGALPQIRVPMTVYSPECYSLTPTLPTH